MRRVDFRKFDVDGFGAALDDVDDNDATFEQK